MPKKQRSPSCPSHTLEVALDKVRAIRTAYERASVSRDILAEAMNYSPSSGPALQMLGTLSGYGLLERGASKGEYRVSELAVKLLHPESAEEFAATARQALLSAPVFAALAEKFGGHVPPESGLVSHLCRNRFTQQAAKKAAQAYIASMYFIEHLGDNKRSESDAGNGHDPSVGTADGGGAPEGRGAPMLGHSGLGEFKEVARSPISGGNAFRLFVKADLTPRDRKSVV